VSGIFYRPGGPVSLVGRPDEPTVRRSQESALRCRWCGRSTTGDTRQVIEHIDRTRADGDWSEHIDCRPLADPDPPDSDWRL
jgi:hypothetical protein